jgi:diguanylate cyclase (GGDEF)-like protein/PAS domain S-box-containing protein
MRAMTRSPHDDASDPATSHRLLLHCEAIFDNASMGVLFTRNRVCECCNPRFAAMFGYADPQALAGQPASVLYRSAEDHAAMGRAAAPILSRGERLDVEWEMRRGDGSTFWARLHAQAVAPGDQSRGTVWIVEDITARRAAEQALRQTLQEQEAILDNVSAGIVFLRDRVIQRCNLRFAELFGLAPDSLPGQTTRLLYASDEEFRLGATAYPLLACGETHSREQLLVRSDGSRFWCRLTGRNVGHGQESVWLLEDVGEQHASREALEQQVHQRTADLAEANARLCHLAHHDELTGLPNRRLLLDRLAQALARARRSGDLVAVMYLDLDRFKTINDSLGHAAGDALLRTIAQRMVGVVREEDTVARLGGDEFVLLLPSLPLASHAVVVGEKIMHSLSRAIDAEGHELHVTPSMGIALFPGDGETPEALLRNADAAMYQAKAAGRDNYQFCSVQMSHGAAPRPLELENDLRHALQRDELFLEFQPRVDLRDGSLQGAEALVRWRHPRHGVLLPGAFIALAEETGLIGRLGEWVLARACRDIQRWREQGVPAFPVAVNLSPRQFRQRDIVQRIGGILRAAGVAAELIELEITETSLMQHTEQTLATLHGLRGMGLRLSIDDFGTGYSSLNYLRRFPVSQLKVDRSFVHDIGADPANAAIVSTVAALARALGLSVVAEGVETAAQLGAVRHCGCEQAQGFLFSRPVPADEVPALVERDWLASFDTVSLNA